MQHYAPVGRQRQSMGAGGGGIFSPEEDEWDETEEFKCPECHQVTRPMPDYVAAISDKNLKFLPCGNFDAHPSDKAPILAIRFQSQWISEQQVMHREEYVGHNGLREVRRDPSHIDRVALTLLCRRYSKQDSDAWFHSVPIRERAKIMWVNGDAVGYYAYHFNGRSPFQNCEWGGEKAIPALNHLYLRQDYRRMGFGSQMVIDCFRNGPQTLKETKFAVESPAQATVALLQKVLTDREKFNLREAKGSHIYCLPFLMRLERRYSVRLSHKLLEQLWKRGGDPHEANKRTKFGDVSSVEEMCTILKEHVHTPHNLPKSVRKCDLLNFIREAGGRCSSSHQRIELIRVALELL